MLLNSRRSADELFQYAPGPPDPHVTASEIRFIIEESIRQQPRSLQRMIGPSEIGQECKHCLAAKLAGWEQTSPPSVPWLPFIGTAVHAMLEGIFAQYTAKEKDLPPVQKPRFLTEHQVTVGTVAGHAIKGSCDLFDVTTGTTVDWKIVGKSTLDKASKDKVSHRYRVQAHLYARGFVNAGYDVTTVAVAFLPRNELHLSKGVWWSEPYDPQIAEQALTDLNQMVMDLQALTSISTEVRDQWIRELPRENGCYDCVRYPDAPTHQQQTLDQLFNI